MDDKKKPIETTEDFADALEDLFEHLIMDDPEFADEILKDEGYDPEKIANQMASFAKNVSDNSSLDWRNRKNELDEKTSKFVTFSNSKNRGRAENEGILDQLYSRLIDKPQAVATAYRNRDQATDEDLASLVSQIEFLISLQDDEPETDED